MSGFSPTFPVQGQVYDLAGSLLPLPGEDPQYLQLYFLGETEQEVKERAKHHSGSSSRAHSSQSPRNAS